MNAVAQDSLKKAIHYLKINKSRSFAHLLVALSLNPEFKSELSSLFISLLDEISLYLIANQKTNDFFKCFEQALELYPDSPDLKVSFSKHLQVLGFTFKAFLFMRSAVKLRPEEPLWNKELDRMKNMSFERWHFRMLNDLKRNEAYKRAICSIVSSTSSVLDIGCGSGLLSLYIAENKPHRHIAVDSNEALYNVALSVFHNCAANIVLKNVMSTSLEPEDISGEVSIIVTEIFDSGFFGEGILQTMIHAHKVLLSKSVNNVIIPKSATLYICGIQSEKLAKRHRVVKSNLTKELRISELIICNNVDEPYDSEDLSLFEDIKYVTEPRQVLKVDLLDVLQLERLYNGDDIMSVTLNVHSNVDINAYAIWFDLQLNEDSQITTNPKVEYRGNAWQQAVIHLNKPITCLENTSIDLLVSCVAGKIQLTNINIPDEKKCYPVSLEIIQLLNDDVYYNMCKATASALCIHLSQVSALKDTHVIDCTSFPIIGILLLCRGIQTLSCTRKSSNIQELILIIAMKNGIDKDRILFLEDHNASDINDIEKYGVFINNYFEHPCPDLISNNIKSQLKVKNHINRINGIVLPHKIKLMGCLIYSDDIERNNRVDNKNVSDYKIAESMNIFQLNQTYVPDIGMFCYERKSNNLLIFEQCIDECSNKIIDIQITESGLINGVLCWYEIQLLENGEIFSTLYYDSHISPILHVLELNLFGNIHQKGNLLVCVEDYCIKLAVDINFDC